MLVTILLELLEPHPANPASRNEDASLAVSIRQHGLINPPLVRPIPDSGGRYQILAGHRRLAGSRVADMAAIPCQVRDDIDDATALEMLLIENLEREALDPMEEARGIGLMQTELGLEVEQIAERLNRGLGFVRSRQLLLDLPEQGQDLVAEGQLGIGAANAIVEIAQEGELDEAVQLVMSGVDGALGETAARALLRQKVELPRQQRRDWAARKAELLDLFPSCEIVADPTALEDYREPWGGYKSPWVAISPHLELPSGLDWRVTALNPGQRVAKLASLAPRRVVIPDPNADYGAIAVFDLQAALEADAARRDAWEAADEDGRKELDAEAAYLTIKVNPALPKSESPPPPEPDPGEEESLITEEDFQDLRARLDGELLRIRESGALADLFSQALRHVAVYLELFTAFPELKDDHFDVPDTDQIQVRILEIFLRDILANPDGIDHEAVLEELAATLDWKPAGWEPQGEA